MFQLALTKGNMSYPYNVPNALIDSEEKKNLGTFQPLEPPFGTDNISPWERDDSSSNGKEKVNQEMQMKFRSNSVSCVTTFILHLGLLCNGPTFLRQTRKDCQLHTCTYPSLIHNQNESISEARDGKGCPGYIYIHKITSTHCAFVLCSAEQRCS